MTHCGPLLRKNGTSAPSVIAMFIRVSLVRLSSQKLLSSARVVAALELPPPSPAPMGIFFWMVIFAVLFLLVCLLSASAVFHAMFSFSGMFRSGSHSMIILSLGSIVMVS